MSTWLTKLSKVKFGTKEAVGASFRGATFYVESAERSGGRRNVKHEYAKRDLPYSEDMGRKARGFPIEGYVLGDDYTTARNTLLTALEAKGPGPLVHPYYGNLSVCVDSFRVRESSDRGGMAVFSIEFSETPAQPQQPTSVVDGREKLVQSASLALAAIGAEFLAKYSPGVLLDSVSGALRSATLAINNVLETSRMQQQTLANLKRLVSRFEDAIEELVNEPSDILADLTDIFALFDTSDALLTVYDFNPGVRPQATTDNREEEQQNFDATQRLIQQLTLIRSSEIAADEDFESYDAALLARETITDLLDEQADDATDDTFPVLLQLRADLVKGVPGASSDLPRLVAHTPKFSTPSLVLAYQLYGDLLLEEDLVNRNRIRHPCFVRGGVALEALSRE